jgi:hypothetical protein
VKLWGGSGVPTIRVWHSRLKRRATLIDCNHVRLVKRQVNHLCHWRLAVIEVSNTEFYTSLLRATCTKSVCLCQPHFMWSPMPTGFRHNITRRDTAEHDVHRRSRACCNELQSVAPCPEYAPLNLCVYVRWACRSFTGSTGDGIMMKTWPAYKLIQGHSR